MGLLDQVRLRAISQVNASLTGSSRSVFEVAAAVSGKASGITRTISQVAQMPAVAVETATNAAAAVQRTISQVAGMPQAISNSIQDAANRLSTSVRALSNLAGSIGSSGSGFNVSSRPSGNSTFNALAAARGRQDPLLNIDWYVELPIISGADGVYSLGWEMVEQATIPLIEFEPVSNYKAGKLYHYPSHQSLSTLSLSHYEDVGGAVTNYYRKWQGLIINSETSLYKVPSEYKKTIKITLLDVTRSEVAVFTYYGCWPSRIDSYALVSGAVDRIIPQVEFTVDDMQVVVVSLSAGELSSIISSSMDSPASVGDSSNVFPSALSSYANNMNMTA